jgi:hypothetical protein
MGGTQWTTFFDRQWAEPKGACWGPASAEAGVFPQLIRSPIMAADAGGNVMDLAEA